MGNGKRSAAAEQRRAEKKAVKVEQKNKLARLEEPNWICLAVNTYGKECGNSNFARRAACNICKAPNPLRIGPNKTRPQKVKQPKPEKQSSWRKNPTALDIKENTRLRLLLDQEKTTSIVCEELEGEIRLRAEVIWKKHHERQKHIEARNKKNELLKAKKLTPGTEKGAGSVDSTKEQAVQDTIIQTVEEQGSKDKEKKKESKKRKDRDAAVAVKEDKECDAECEIDDKTAGKKGRSEMDETSEEKAARKARKKDKGSDKGSDKEIVADKGSDNADIETSEERAARKARKKEKKRQQADIE